MPIYEYECASCHHHFDLMQKYTDSPVTQCPECLKNTVTKLISPAGFQLKGTGWYATDFKDKGTAAKSSTDSSKTESTTSKDTTTTKSTESTKGDSA
ncbi:FmdB family zinc ribbon protein [Legionella worsleiensis]|uniref:Zinc ribbon domain protein n=1 Tax=Legionella worsleiensis TaxID=45076 RepID=A0A0W1A761_9GAMM|nr:FmdB family zinc ribbon protein [Legionella worsleiensis]KTD76883.1 Zinc ribbon domain protein [Legionella worsleiensis]STY33447.1 Type I antifreeze protein [Legionella worsleiensis]